MRVNRIVSGTEYVLSRRWLLCWNHTERAFRRESGNEAKHPPHPHPLLSLCPRPVPTSSPGKAVCKAAGWCHTGQRCRKPSSVSSRPQALSGRSRPCSASTSGLAGAWTHSLPPHPASMSLGRCAGRCCRGGAAQTGGDWGQGSLGASCHSAPWPAGLGPGKEPGPPASCSLLCRSRNTQAGGSQEPREPVPLTQPVPSPDCPSVAGWVLPTHLNPQCPRTKALWTVFLSSTAFDRRGNRLREEKQLAQSYRVPLPLSPLPRLGYRGVSPPGNKTPRPRGRVRLR